MKANMILISQSGKTFKAFNYEGNKVAILTEQYQCWGEDDNKFLSKCPNGVIENNLVIFTGIDRMQLLTLFDVPWDKNMKARTGIAFERI